MKCIICGKELEEKELDVCKTCFDVLRIKYPDYNKFKEVIKWHKEHAKEIKEN